jgi:hypothetical protein
MPTVTNEIGLKENKWIMNVTLTEMYQQSDNIIIIIHTLNFEYVNYYYS